MLGYQINIELILIELKRSGWEGGMVEGSSRHWTLSNETSAILGHGAFCIIVRTIINHVLPVGLFNLHTNGPSDNGC